MKPIFRHPIVEIDGANVVEYVGSSANQFRIVRNLLEQHRHDEAVHSIERDIVIVSGNLAVAGQNCPVPWSVQLDGDSRRIFFVPSKHHARQCCGEGI